MDEANSGPELVSGNGETVLVVDDEAAVRDILSRTLRQAGFEVVTAGDGEEAVRAFRRRRPDLVLCDLFLPGKDGFEVIRELHRDFVGVQILAMSGGDSRGSVDLLPAAQRLGFDGVLDKPFRLDTMLAAVKRAPSAVNATTNNEVSVPVIAVPT